MFSTTQLSIHGFVPQIDGFMALKKMCLALRLMQHFKKLR